LTTALGGQPKAPNLDSRAFPYATPAVVLLLACGAALRFSALENQSLWLDEYLAIFIGQAPLAEIWQRSSGIPGQSPAYYLLVRGWTDVLGRESVAVLRALSATLGVVSLVQAFAFVRRFVGVREAVAALAVLAFSPLHLYFSQEARMYPLLVVLVLAMTHLAWSLWRDPAARRAWRWVGLGAVTAAALYTHYYAVLFIGALDLALLLSAILAPRSEDRRLLLGIAAVQLCAALAYAPWIPALLHAAGSGGNPFIRFVALKGFYTAFTFALGYSAVVIDATHKADLPGHFLRHAPLILAAGVAFGALAGLGLVTLWRRDRGFALLTLSMLGAPVLVATAVSLRFPIISERYFSPGLPFFALLVGVGIVAGRGRWRLALAGLAAMLVLGSLYRYYFDPAFGHHDWRQAAALVDSGPAGDPVLVHPGFVRPLYDFYATAPNPSRGLDTPDAAAALPEDRGAWLLISHPRPEVDAIVERLDRKLRRVDERLLPRGEGIRVLRYAPRGGPTDEARP